MAVVLAATGAFLYLRLTASLDETIDESLQARSAELATRVAARQPIGAAGELDERFAQVLDGAGDVVENSSGSSSPLLSPEEAAAVVGGATVQREIEEVPGVDDRARTRATRVQGQLGPLALVVGASLEDRDETVRSFLLELLVVGPAALVLASLLGYGLASAALRPVEAMRREADTISGSEPGRRLPLPETQDEIRRLGETLNEMLKRLEGALGRERAFVADAGHELRTPLAHLRIELELALRRPRSAAELEEALRSAAEETDRLAMLADDLLLLARSDHGEIPLRRRLVSARDTLHAVAERYESHLREAGRELSLAQGADAMVYADPQRLEQALGALVENALDHGAGAVLLSVEPCASTVELHVRDEGSGFPPEFLGRAFDRFAQADGARTGTGSGLGLAISEAVALAHGGSAHAANLEGRGADVWLALPTA
jgi:signal transduction histidine kinase